MIIDLIINRQSTCATIKTVRVYLGTDYGSNHYVGKAKIGYNCIKNKAITFSEQTKVKCCYPTFKLEFLQDEALKVYMRNK